MSKFEYTDEMVTRLTEVGSAGLTEEVIEGLMAEFEFPRRSVTAKLRKLGFEVPKKPATAPVFSAEETEVMKQYLADHAGEFTVDELAAYFSETFGRTVEARQVSGKALSLEAREAIKPSEKKVAPKTYSDEEEAQIVELVEAGKFIEEVAEALGRDVKSIRGKLLSLGLKAPQKVTKAATADAYAGIEDMLEKTVAEIAAAFGKTDRGVKTVLTRRGLACSDYTPKAAKAE